MDNVSKLAHSKRYPSGLKARLLVWQFHISDLDIYIIIIIIIIIIIRHNRQQIEKIYIKKINGMCYTQSERKTVTKTTQ